MKQLADRLLMIRPKYFGSNSETKGSNTFQATIGDGESDKVSEKAVSEFDKYVSLLQDNDVGVDVFEQPSDNLSPDIVFPNNWFSIHPEGFLIFYPMESKTRRTERLQTVKDFLIRSYPDHEVIDMSWFENENKFLEGTGSMVMDRKNKRIFCAISSRSAPDLLTRVGEILKYEVIPFETQENGIPIYHTNVLMAIGSDLAVFCPDCVKGKKAAKQLESLLLEGRHNVIKIDSEQLNSFCGNVLEIKNHKGKKGVLMSQKAMKAFSDEQIDVMKKDKFLVAAHIPTIEKYGGGSARCMVSELL